VNDGELGVVDDGEKRREWWATGRGRLLKVEAETPAQPALKGSAECRASLRAKATWPSGSA
jgi:hypothetical protein